MVTEPASSTASQDAGFASRVRSALAWRWGTQVLAQLMTWASTFAVIRILTPADYGLFAMTQAVLTALAFLNGYSFATSLIQAKEINDRRVGQVFGMLIVAGFALAAIQFLCAPLAAAYYGQPEVEQMLRVQALIFLTTPFIALPSALLARRIEFRNQGMVNLLCAFVGATTALTLALLGFGVWALVYAPIAMAATRAIGLTVSARLLVKPVFDFRGAWDIVSFGGALTLCQFLWIIQSQSDVLIAGPQFAPDQLGIYTTSLFLVLIVTGKFIPPINEVLFPALSELSNAGRPLAPFFIRTLRTVALVTAPRYVGLALTADAVVPTILGDQWANMVPIITGLALAMPFFALQIVCSPATNAIGKPRIYVATSTIGALVFPVAFMVGVAGGPMGLVHAWWVASPVLLVMTLALTLPAIEVRVVDLLKQLLPIALACAVMTAAVYLTKPLIADFAAPLRLLILVPIGAVTYGATVWFLWPSILRETWAMVRHRDDPVSEPQLVS